jgi:acyl carrier protein
MPDPEIFERVRRIFADVLNAPIGTLLTRSCPEDIPAWDSVQHLSIILALEQAFRVQFDPDEMDQLTTLGHFVVALELKLQGHS